MWSLAAGAALQSAAREGLFTLPSVPVAAANEKFSLNTFFCAKELFLLFKLFPFPTWSDAALGAIVGVSEAGICSVVLFSFGGCAE